MDNAIYAALTRQSGLSAEMRTIANNMANSNTTGFRREGVIFAEHLSALDGRGETLSMATAEGRRIDLSAASLDRTGGTWDLALEGEGFFMIDTPQGQRLTRAGAFTPNAGGEIVNFDGNRLLDDGGAPIAVPAGTRAIAVGGDGTVSADGQPIARIGVFASGDPSKLSHESGTMFSAEGATPMPQAMIRQGFLESSNVNPVLEVSRMIEVQRAYELGQSFLDAEDQRIRTAITAMTR